MRAASYDCILLLLLLWHVIRRAVDLPGSLHLLLLALAGSAVLRSMTQLGQPLTAALACQLAFHVALTHVTLVSCQQQQSHHLITGGQVSAPHQVGIQAAQALQRMVPAERSMQVVAALCVKWQRAYTGCRVLEHRMTVQGRRQHTMVGPRSISCNETVNLLKFSIGGFPAGMRPICAMCSMTDRTEGDAWCAAAQHA